MNVISISTDRTILKKGSAAWKRQGEYGALFSETHIVLFSLRVQDAQNRTSSSRTSVSSPVEIAPHVWVYPTHSSSKLLYVRDAIRIARSIVRDRNFLPRDTVITTQDPFETGLVGLRLAKKYEIPLHVQIHTDFLSPYFTRFSFLNTIRVRIARRVLPRADAIRVVSKRIADSIHQSDMKIRALVSIVPIFVDAAYIESVEPQVSVRSQYPQYKLIVLITGRLVEEKNIPMALEVFARLLEQFPEAGLGLVVVGEGPQKESLEAIVKSLKIAPNVVFEPWRDDILSYYKTADMFFSTSWYEGYGLALVEAALARCCVLATDAGVAPDIFDRAVVCRPGDTKSFFENAARLTQKLLTVPADAKTLTEDAYARVHEIISKNHTEYLEQYKKTITHAIK